MAFRSFWGRRPHAFMRLGEIRYVHVGKRYKTKSSPVERPGVIWSFVAVFVRGRSRAHSSPIVAPQRWLAGFKNLQHTVSHLARPLAHGVQHVRVVELVVDGLHDRAKSEQEPNVQIESDRIEPYKQMYVGWVIWLNSEGKYMAFM